MRWGKMCTRRENLERKKRNQRETYFVLAPLMSLVILTSRERVSQPYCPSDYMHYCVYYSSEDFLL